MNACFPHVALCPYVARIGQDSSCGLARCAPARGAGRRVSTALDLDGLGVRRPSSSSAHRDCWSGSSESLLRSVECYSGNGNGAGRRSESAVSSDAGPDREGSSSIAGPPAKFSSLVSAEITPRTERLFVSEVEGDPDRPTEGFSSVLEAVSAIAQGKFVVVVDDEDRENEGDLIMAASLATPEAMAFMVNHCTGIVCVGMKGEALDRLHLPLMVPDQYNEEAMVTAFTVTVDARMGTNTGVSASDRAKTVTALGDMNSSPEQFKRPGHIFPLRSRQGGVLKRAGHTEASVDLSELAGLSPAGVLCELVDHTDGSMSRLPELKKFAEAHNLPIISIADLVRFKRKRNQLVKRTAVARLPTQWGAFQGYSYTSQLDGIEHIAMAKGDIGDGLDVLVRVHSECLTGDIFRSARCDCGNQLAESMQAIERQGRGVLVYLRGHEGRGIGLGHKLQAYDLQDAGRDTVDLGLPVDSREYGIGAQILKDMGVRTMKLLTNNPSKFLGLKGYGLTVSRRVPILSPRTKENTRYMETKRDKMEHVYGSDLGFAMDGDAQDGDGHNGTELTALKMDEGM